MPFSWLNALPDVSPKDLIRAFKELVQEKGYVQDIDADEAVLHLKSMGKKLTTGHMNEILAICDQAISKTIDVNVKQYHWQLVKDWIHNNMQ